MSCTNPVGTALSVTIATRMRQVQRQLWPHVRRLHARAGLPGKVDTTQWRMADTHGVLTDVAYGFCYDEDTEVLTRERGWLTFQKLTGAEHVATRSPDGAFEWQQPSHVVDQPYAGPMLRFRSQVYDLFVTPNHRMQVRRKRKKGVRHRPGLGREWHYRPAEWFAGNPTRGVHYEMPGKSTWAAPHPGDITLPGDVTMSAEAFVGFLGLYLAEGWVSGEAATDKYHGRISVCQAATSRHHGSMTELLAATGLDWRFSPGSGPTKGYFSVTNRPLAQWLRENTYTGAAGGRSWEKRLPDFVKDYPPDLLNLLFDAMMAGDGHVEKNGHRRYLTTSRALADDLLGVLQKAGHEGWISTLIPHATAKGRRPQYRIPLRPGEAHQVPNPVTEHYEGRIGCVTVPNGTVFVRRNGRTAWCGNSPPDQDEHAVSGIHVSGRLLLVVDEAGGIAPVIGKSTRNLLTGNSVMLAIGNPPTDEESGWFESRALAGHDPDRPDIVTLPIGAIDSPAVTGERLTCRDCPPSVGEHQLAIHLVDRGWIDEAIRDFTEESPYVQAKVYARFPKGGPLRVIPLAWLEEAADVPEPGKPDWPRLADLHLPEERAAWKVEPGAWIRLGVDVAADGGDEMVIARCVGDLLTVEHHSAGPTNANAVDVAGKILAQIRRAEALRDALGSAAKVRVKVDSIGVGWGVTSVLTAWGKEGMHSAQIVGVNVAENTDRIPDGSAMVPYRKRDEMWLAMRSLVTPNPAAGRPLIRLRVDQKTIAQLSAPTYGTTSNGQTQVESKKSMRERGISSPDRAEACLLVVVEPKRRVRGLIV